uniref:C2H2-type domain-containing protein n=1 Tax=Wuchereria bancrofti TaxID=6293 RepID=A0AAF5Q626_WUCBA
MITKNYNEYLTHRKTHGQPFIYECRVPGCGRTFYHESSLRSHKQTHESNPQCKGCGKLFTRRDTLQNHKKRCSTEFRERSYECLYRGCAMITKNYNEYLTHRKTHGQPFIYECKVPGCGRTFHHESSLRSHKQTHESNPQCKGCGKFFTTRNGLRYHKKSCQINSP